MIFVEPYYRVGDQTNSLTNIISKRFTKIRLLLRLARPHFLVTGVMLYVLGVLLAIANGAAVELTVLILGYVIFLFAHISMHFSNDYFDRKGDEKSQRTSMSGGSGVLVEHPEMAHLALIIAVLLLMASAVTATAFTLYYSYPLSFLMFAILGALLGWFYNAPPLRLAYRGLGEISTVIALGFIMPGLGYFVASGTIDLWFVILMLPLFCYGLFFIVTVEMPDIESDRMAGRENLLVDHGLEVGTKVALFATVLATTLLFTIAYTGVLNPVINIWPLAWFSLVPIVIAAYGAGRDLQKRNKVLFQVKLNIGGIICFVLVFIGIAFTAP